MRGDALAIAHAIPGRLRLRLPHAAQTEGLAEAVGAVHGVTACESSPRTRSLLIRYRADAVTPATVLDTLAAHAGVGLADDVASRASMNGPAQPPLAAVVVDTVGELNHGIRRATGGRLSLALVVPLGLTLWAVFDVMRGPIRPLAWSSALWYAHGLFRDYALRDTHTRS